jgi:copper resistance protein B
VRAAARAAAIGAGAALVSAPALAQNVFWAFQAEEMEYRLGEGGEDVFAWDTDAFVGTDELKLRWVSKAEYVFEEDVWEDLENQLRLQTPISAFWDVVAGVRVDTPAGPNKVYGVLGVHGLAPQWTEVDADFYISENPTFEIDAEYEGLITNWLILTPSIEFAVPLTDDEELGNGAFGPVLEVGARLSYDLVGRAVAPYVGVHYERAFGETANLRRADDEDAGAVFFVTGAKLLF